MFQSQFNKGIFMENKVAIVTGGSRGIGASIAKDLARQGATVIINYASNADAANKVVAEIAEFGGKAEAVKFDVSNEEAVNLAIDEVIKKYSKIDILVNNAGISVDSLFVRTKTDDWAKTLDINLNGCFYCARAASKHMMKARTGRIINISSVIGEMGNAGQVAYSTSKAGLLGFTKSLARELASRGITVNAITPGYITTDMTGALNEAQTTAIMEKIPCNRLGSPEDISSLVGFLAGDSSSYITGQVIGVNGGMYM